MLSLNREDQLVQIKVIRPSSLQVDGDPIRSKQNILQWFHIQNRPQGLGPRAQTLYWFWHYSEKQFKGILSLITPTNVRRWNEQSEWEHSSRVPIKRTFTICGFVFLFALRIFLRRNFDCFHISVKKPSLSEWVHCQPPHVIEFTDNFEIWWKKYQDEIKIWHQNWPIWNFMTWGYLFISVVKIRLLVWYAKQYIKCGCATWMQTLIFVSIHCSVLVRVSTMNYIRSMSRCLNAANWKILHADERTMWNMLNRLYSVHSAVTLSNSPSLPIYSIYMSTYISNGGDLYSI